MSTLLFPALAETGSPLRRINKNKKCWDYLADVKKIEKKMSNSNPKLYLSSGQDDSVSERTVLAGTQSKGTSCKTCRTELPLITFRRGCGGYYCINHSPNNIKVRSHWYLFLKVIIKINPSQISGRLSFVQICTWSMGVLVCDYVVNHRLGPYGCAERGSDEIGVGVVGPVPWRDAWETERELSRSEPRRRIDQTDAASWCLVRANYAATKYRKSRQTAVQQGFMIQLGIITCASGPVSMSKDMLIVGRPAHALGTSGPGADRLHHETITGVMVEHITIRFSRPNKLAWTRRVHKSSYFSKATRRVNDSYTDRQCKLPLLIRKQITVEHGSPLQTPPLFFYPRTAHNGRGSSLAGDAGLCTDKPP